MKYKNTEIGKIPVDWEVIKLGQVADVLSGFAFKSKDFVEKGVPVIKIKNIVPPYVTIDDSVYVSHALYEQSKKYQLKFNDILISMTGSNYNQLSSAVGKVGRVRIKNVPMLLNQRVGKIVVNEQKCNKEFLYYNISTMETRYRLALSAGGSANQANISPKQIKSLFIPFPPLKEQESIASILSSLDEKIEANEKINKKIEEMAQTIFKQWFTDFEFPNENSEPFKSNGGAMVESELGLIPKGWEIKTINEISLNENVICGKTPSTKNKEYYDGNVPFITIPDMHNRVYITKTERYLSEIGAESQKSKTLPKNSICVSCIATPGLVVLTSEDSQTNQQINSFQCKEGISYYYVYLNLLNRSEEIRTLGSSGSTTLNLNKTQFSKMKILLPSLELMNRFHRKLDPFFKSMLSRDLENIRLKNVRDTLLPKLMSGEIRVPLEN